MSLGEAGFIILGIRLYAMALGFTSAGILIMGVVGSEHLAVAA